MSETGHDLHSLFPDDAATLHLLKIGNAHFRALAEQHHALEKDIHQIEAGLEPASDDRLEALKKERLSVLDAIATLVEATRA
ncbi:DUF465 domain-containing protein [Hankyongella ginsenosidimutans]|uniref:DUF465 domain-containing protein n=1 Tax=Hankyongella ginsenosidimutans TaxID=1763828 RepID=A0A4D7C172_9SPHN|nr:DUF465 domain-containing protein [Hankyongella ginsenosidimutans]QCI79464.1 DUF465 domain-containing protein [Hankyongella ginsenosidimutans]